MAGGWGGQGDGHTTLTKEGWFDKLTLYQGQLLTQQVSGVIFCF